MSKKSTTCASGEDAGEKYMQLRDMPAEDLPREKLQRLGRKALTDEELIALFLRTGLQGCNVLELAAKLKRAAGSLAELGAMEAVDIMQVCKGIGPAKAATLAAVFELGHRAVAAKLERQLFNCAQVVYDYLAPELRLESQECLVALLLDAQNRLLRRVDVARGTLTRVVVHPRDVLGHALRYNAHAVILAHNHPSGDPTPSKADRHMTEELVKGAALLGIGLIDHVVVGASAPTRQLPFYSFREQGTMPHVKLD